MVTTFMGDDEDRWNSFANWLDVVWLAHGLKHEKLIAKSREKLKTLVNYENAIALLVAAHTIGDKDLRSTCVDYMIKNSIDIEKFNRMKQLSDRNIGEVAQLSESLMVEVQQKVMDKVSNLKVEKKTGVKVSPLHKKKRTCVLCKRVMLKEDLRSAQLPPVFGFSKERLVCTSCASIAQLLPSPSNPSNGDPSHSRSRRSEDRSRASQSHKD
jgi:hypothetical protein